jgi:hypothetical protein
MLIQSSNHLYDVEGLLQSTPKSAIYLATRRSVFAERVVIKKYLPTLDDTSIVCLVAKREIEFLQDMCCKIYSSIILARAVPSLVDFSLDGSEVFLVYRWRSGFIHTINDVLLEYPQGVDGQTLVWIWKRVLAQIEYMHNKENITHGNILPEHILLHTRDHGATLLGWSKVNTVKPNDDLRMLAHAMFRLIGGKDNFNRLPPKLASFLEKMCNLELSNYKYKAFNYLQELDDIAVQTYGKNRFHPLDMNDWRGYGVRSV